VALTGVERAHAERVSTLNVREHVEPFSPGGRMRVELFATEEIEMTRLRRLLLSWLSPRSSPCRQPALHSPGSPPPLLTDPAIVGVHALPLLERGEIPRLRRRVEVNHP
jgi:hypothetical protein